jgi:hypothetical protein
MISVIDLIPNAVDVDVGTTTRKRQLPPIKASLQAPTVVIGVEAKAIVDVTFFRMTIGSVLFVTLLSALPI